MSNNTVVLLGSYAANATDALVVPLPSVESGYAMFEFVISNLQPTKSNGLLQMNYQINGVLATDNNYNTEGYSNDTGGNHAFSSWQNNCFTIYDTARLGAAANNGVCGRISLFAAEPGNDYTCFLSNIYAPVAAYGGGCMNLTDGAYLGNQGQVTAVQFQFANDVAINSGTVYVYGYLGA